MNYELKDLYNILAEAKTGKLLYSSKVLSGLSSNALTSLLQRFSTIIDAKNECYLEIGVFQGLSLLSVSKAAPEIEAYGIDNFSQFDLEGTNFDLVKQRAKDINCENHSIINEDFEFALENIKNYIGDKKIGLYFIDGPHDYRSQLLCLEIAKNHLSKNAIVIIDDCNYLHVRQATYDFLKLNPEFKLFFEGYTDKHPHLLNKNEEPGLWWDGIHVLVKNQDDLNHTFPEIDPQREIFFEDHRFMSTKYPLALYEAGLLSSALKPFRPIKVVKRFFKLWKKVRNTHIKGSHDYLNTFSGNIAKERINK